MPPLRRDLPMRDHHLLCNMRREAMTTTTDWDHVGGYGPEEIAGHSGSETSEEAARIPKGKRMKEVLEHISAFYDTGATCGEVQHAFGIHHGAASGALTRLHRAGYVVRLTERRGGQQVYVLPEYADGREESHYRPNAAYREDRKPMPLERPEPTVDSIIEDTWQLALEPPPKQRMIAELILENVRKYR